MILVSGAHRHDSMMFEKCERSECERWSELGVNIVNEWHFRGFRAMLQSLKEQYGWELFNIYRFRHIIDYAILLAFCLTVNYCMLYFWIIPDYTDPRYTTIWKNTYITYFWTRGMCVTLGTALLGILACLAVAAPVRPPVRPHAPRTAGRSDGSNAGPTKGGS